MRTSCVQLRITFGLVAVFAAQLFVAPSMGAQELPFTHFTPDAGPARLPSSSVQKVHQDRLGYIWLGFFSSGLGRYDGHSITLYNVSDGLGDLTVRDFLEDASGRLWVASETGTYASELPLGEMQPDQRIRFVTAFGSTPLPSERMGRNQMVLMADGRLAISTRRGLVTYRFAADGSLERGVIPVEGNPGAPTFLGSGPGGALWIAFADGEFGRYVPGGDHVELWRDSALSASTASTLVETADGSLWVGNVSGELWRRGRDGGSFTRVSTKLTERIPSITEMADGELWVASLGSGLLRFDPRHPDDATRYTRLDGLLGETLWSTLIDREGSLWIAQNGGISRLRSDFESFISLSGVSHLGETPVLPAPECFAVVPPSSDAAGEPSGWTWIATAGGVAVRNSTGSIATIGTDEGLLSSSVYSLLRDGSGTIWIGTAAGLNAVTFGETAGLAGMATSQSIELSGIEARVVGFWALPSERVYAVRRVQIEAGHERTDLVCTTGSSGVHCLCDGDWMELSSDKGSMAAYDVTADADGRIWVATPEGGVLRTHVPVTRARLDSWRNAPPEGGVLETVWNRDAGAPSDHFRSLTVAGNRVWAGAAGGVAVFETTKNAKPRFLSSRDGIGDGIAASMVTSQDGSVWINQSEGVVEVDAESLDVRRSLTRREGLIDDEVWGPEALAIGAAGKLYVATPRGVSIVDTAALKGHSNPPPLRIERYTSSEGKRKNNEVVIEYAALSYRNEEKVRYRTRLVGYDDEWSDPTSETTLRFTNLSPRTYVFEVIAANDEGVWTPEPLRYSFVIAR
jgi:ligand-binding sensor domain-containing protein